MSLAAVGPARLVTIKADAAGKMSLKIAAVGGRLQRIVRRALWLGKPRAMPPFVIRLHFVTLPALLAGRLPLVVPRDV